ncbi:hypothetical protein Nepgr_025908 [Nepenthes gracilis]|uniref:APO domain-containing protein n=1 Tax=Nepenthes gracilis TaxID=150966 RepID=A0AAD3T5Z9_NEPGR|nr:hypothetical protein Nepgr_025908 [Nepenthes gracilis]
MIRSCLPHFLEIHKTMLLQMQIPKRINYRLIQSLHHSKVGIQAPTFGRETDDPFYVDVPKPRRRKSDRKPYPTPMKVLIRKAREEKELRKAHPCRLLEHPPDDDLLIHELISVAYQVYRTRESLLVGIPKLIQFIPVLRCRFCFEVHTGPVGHQIRTCNGPKSGLRRAMHVWRKGDVQDVIHFPKCYHNYDRVGKPRAVHNERYTVQCIPAVVELCIQAGVDLV